MDMKITKRNKSERKAYREGWVAGRREAVEMMRNRLDKFQAETRTMLEAQIQFETYEDEV